MNRFSIVAVVASLIGWTGCGGGADQDPTPPVDQDLVVPTDGKAETGYMSTLATELEGEFRGTLLLDVSAMTPEERAGLLEEYQRDNHKVRSLASQQLKYAKKKCNSEQLHMNLYSDEIEAESVELVDEQTLQIVYKARLESIVSHEELEEAGRDIQDVIGSTTVARVPADPRDLFSRAQDRCADGFDPGSLTDYNYFYYFDPDKPACDIPLAEAQFTVSSLSPPDTTYPEYDRLGADGKVTAFVVFGAAGHEDEVSSWDWGVREWRDFKRYMQDRGFEKESDLEPGERFSRTRNGVLEIIDVVSPYDIYHSPESDDIFKRGIAEHELILYNGHSFYGSLGVLQDCSVYPQDTYQVFHMGSCWSYEYYTRQIFECRKSESDPHGWDLADVVNDTESGWFHNNAEFSRILLTNIFNGVETKGRDGDRYFTWFNIIAAMNKHAMDAWHRHGTETHEIMGVSGVKNNKYDPEAGGGGGGARYESRPGLAIPDDDPAGASDEITATEPVTPARITVAVDISHSYIGDLRVVLVREDTEVVLHDRDGGWQKNLVREYEVTDPSLLGRDASGSWRLVVTDEVQMDTGTLNAWSITFAP